MHLLYHKSTDLYRGIWIFLLFRGHYLSEVIPNSHRGEINSIEREDYGKPNYEEPPPRKKTNSLTLVTIKKFMDISVVGEERRIVADDSASIRLFFLFFQTA